LYAAQETERQYYMARLFKSLPQDKRHAYEQFTPGSFIDYKGQKSGKYLVNYNRFLSTVEYINESGDTVAMTDFHPARMVITNIDTIMHVPGEGFLRLDHANNERVALASKELVLVVSRNQVEDEDPKPGVPSKKEQFTAVYIPRDPTLRNEQVLLVTRKTSFLIDESNRIYPTSARGFIQAFRKHRSFVENRINARLRDQQPINFQKETEVTQFLDFCNRLEKMNLH
jgi:hypothetical protein